MVIEAREITIGPEEREQRGRLRAIEEALKELHDAYWRALEHGERRLIVTLSVKAEWKDA